MVASFASSSFSLRRGWLWYVSLLSQRVWNLNRSHTIRPLNTTWSSMHFVPYQGQTLDVMDVPCEQELVCVGFLTSQARRLNSQSILRITHPTHSTSWVRSSWLLSLDRYFDPMRTLAERHHPDRQNDAKYICLREGIRKQDLQRDIIFPASLRQPIRMVSAIQKCRVRRGQTTSSREQGSSRRRLTDRRGREPRSVVVRSDTRAERQGNVSVSTSVVDSIGRLVSICRRAVGGQGETCVNTHIYAVRGEERRDLLAPSLSGKAYALGHLS